MGDLRKVEFFGGTALEDIQHVAARGLEVCRRIVGAGNEHLAFGAQIDRLVNIVYLDESKQKVTSSQK